MEVVLVILHCHMYITGYAASQWLSSWLQMLGVAMVTGVAFTAVLEHHLNSVDPGVFLLLNFLEGDFEICVCLIFAVNKCLCSH